MVPLSIYTAYQSLELGVWHSDRTSVGLCLFDWWTLPVLYLTNSWWVTTYVSKPSATGNPTRPTQPFILLGLIDEYKAAIRCPLPQSMVAPSGKCLRGKGKTVWSILECTTIKELYKSPLPLPFNPYLSALSVLY